MADIVLESPFGPEWLAGDKINELEFCKAFLEQHPMICIHGTFFTTDGRVTDENKLKKKILEWISPYVFSGIPKKITNLLDTMRVLAYSEPLAPRSFSSYIIQHEKDYNLEYSNNVMNQGNRRVRGFWGIEPLVKIFP